MEPESTSLPVELWQAVFSFLTRRSDLYAASLACRLWNGPALERLWALGPIPHNLRSVREFLRVVAGTKNLSDVGILGFDNDGAETAPWEPPEGDSPERRHLRASGFFSLEDDTKGRANTRVERADGDTADCIPYPGCASVGPWKTPLEYAALVRHFSFLGDFYGGRSIMPSGALVNFLVSRCPGLRTLVVRQGLSGTPNPEAGRAYNLSCLRVPGAPYESLQNTLEPGKVTHLDVLVDPTLLVAVLEAFPNVRSLTFARHGLSGPDGTPPIDPVLPDLNQLSLDDEGENSLAHLVPSLSSVKLVGFHVTPATDEYGSRLLTKLAPQIRRLTVRATRMKDLLCLDKLSNLEALHLHDLPNLPQILVATSSVWAPRIRSLYLCSRSTMFEVGFLLRQLDPRNLRELTLKCLPSRRRNDLGFVDPTTTFLATPSPQLVAPSLALSFVPLSFPNLEVLRFEGFEISDLDQFLENLASTRGPRPQLRVLGLSDQPQMAPDPLLDCLRKLKVLQVLSLAACNLDDRVVAEVLVAGSGPLPDRESELPSPRRRRDRSRSESSASGSELLATVARRNHRQAHVDADWDRRLSDGGQIRRSQLRRCFFGRNPGVTLEELAGLVKRRDMLLPAELAILDLLGTRATEQAVAGLRESLPHIFGATGIRIGSRRPLEDEDWIFEGDFD
ncbi:hypothetical protein DFJ74DRAFT_446303 [Hyaloraphidium curvatum]|nr:hypothetical protein DFJ74DRAFT_446303 [Hyaloraphidium curvatum]